MIEWKEDKGLYANGYHGMRGRFQFFYISWDAGSPPRNDDGDTLNWRLDTQLPGLVTHLGHYLTKQEAKDRAERVLKIWLDQAKLKPESKLVVRKSDLARHKE